MISEEEKKRGEGKENIPREQAKSDRERERERVRERD